MSARSRAASGCSRSTRETARAKARYWPVRTACVRSPTSLMGYENRNAERRTQNLELRKTAFLHSSFCILRSAFICSSFIVQKMSCDHHPLNFRSSFADRAELDVAIVLLGGEVFDEAVTAEDLHSFFRAAHRDLGCIQFGHGRERGDPLAVVFGHRGAI